MVIIPNKNNLEKTPEFSAWPEGLNGIWDEIRMYRFPCF